MVKRYVIFVLLIFTIAFASAQINQDYQVIEDSVLVEINLLNTNITQLQIPYDVVALELNTEYKIEEIRNYKIIKIQENPNITIKYITKTPLDKSRNKYYFILENPIKMTSNITVSLPESAILSEQKSFSPDAKSITTDGRKLKIKWDTSEKQLFISYEFLKNNNIQLYVIILILGIGFIIYYIFKKTPKKEKTRNLFGEEKKIIEYLLRKKNKEAWTKEVIRDLDISKVKLSRKIKSLEKKQIISKIPYGNANKIRLK
jgi:uncharacterized membrane protein